ncbi:DUF4083 family protein [Paenibacillus solani]|uniref:DUF4083 domain-containing protein n=1 Tax=Paenibacillus solani TaxID=1705565 RepID=A0A0M1P6W3_9BACL|nr:DUF4083 family protein [Paenibacillus solani]KOR90221.1 hypothetical protein AM231_14480 [Paenibacillus solani]
MATWMLAASLIYQIIIVVLMVLFFIGLYRFVSRLIQHTKNTKESLRRLEEKVDKLHEELNNINR